MSDINDIKQDDDRRLREIVVELIIEFKLIIFAGFGLIALHITNYYNLITIPDIVWISANWFLVTVLAIGIPYLLVISYAFSEDTNVLFEIDISAKDVDEPHEPRFRLWNLGDNKMKELRWKREPYMVSGVPFCINYDPDENVARGPWISELSEIELLRFRSSLKDARQVLVPLAAEGIAAKEGRKTDAIKSQKENMRAIMKQLLQSTTLGADDILEVIDDVQDGMADQVAERDEEEQELLEKAQTIVQQDAGGNNE